MAESKKRKLAAIFFADIQGYTSMMQSDEANAMVVLKRFQQVIKTEVARFNGELVKSYGDGSLVIFDSTLDAMQCAFEMQKAFQTTPKVPLRIGLHLGEIIKEEGDYFGNGINIASRIESMSVPGGVLFSKDVAKRIKNHPEFKMSSLGTFEFKNVEEPIEVFALTNTGFPLPTGENLKGKLKTPQKTTTLLQNKWLWVLGVLLIAAGAWYFINQNKAEIVADTDGYTRFLIMPFEVQGGPEVEYLGKGMVDLLSAQLDGIGNVRSIDPNIVLSKLKANLAGVRDPQYAQNTFSDLSPDRIVLGTVVKLGDQFRFNASVYDAKGELLLKEEVATEQESQLPQVIDELGQKLISNELAQSGLESESMAALLTSNSKALKKYLEGEDFRRNSRFSEANEAFEDAVQLDSTLALAWYKLYQNSGWSRGKYTQQELYQKSKLLQQRLPEKFQLLFQLAESIYSYDHDQARYLYRKGINQYGEDVDLLQDFGDYIFHNSIRKLGHYSEAKPYFLKVLQYRPNETEALVHLIEIAHFEKDIPAIDSLMDKADPNSDYWTVSRIEQLLLKDSIHDIAALSEVANSKNLGPFGIFGGSDGTDLQKMDTLFNQLLNLNTSFPEELKSFCRMVIDHSRGKKAIAHSEREKDGSSQWMARFIGDPVLNPDIAHYASMKQWFINSQTDYSLRDLWTLNLYNATLGDESDYEATRQKIASYFDSEQGDYARLLHLYCEVVRLRNIGENETTLVYIDSLQNQKKSPGVKFLYNENFGIIHLIKAQILYEAEKYEEAYQWFATVPNFLFAKNFLTGPATYRMGQIQDRLGNAQLALQHFDYFIELYQDCDEIYQPWLEDAKQAKKRLFAQLN